MSENFNWGYYSRTSGVRGTIKEQIDDFIVRERATHDLEKGNHLILKMTKYNLTTLEALRELSNILHVPLEIFGYAGNKDKRAITTQHISAKNMDREQFKRVFIPNIELEPLGYGKHISLGQLESNSFDITIRKINVDSEDIIARLNEIWKELNGRIPNYFGDQRFGTVRPITHIIGKHILQGDYDAAVWTYIGKSVETEPERIRKVRKELWESRDASRAAEKFPKQFVYEKVLLYYLAKRPKDSVGAIKQLPLGLQKLFVHGYQSYLFNIVLSELIKKGFDKEYELPLVGYKTTFKNSEPDQKLKELLEKEKMDISSFKLYDLPYLKLEGSYRSCFAKVKNFRIIKAGEDELNMGKNKAKISFELGKGCYATSVLREFMKK